MLSPEVWNFSPPDSCIKEITGIIKSGNTNLPPQFRDFYFTHLISFLLPDSKELRNLTEEINSDLDYYKAVDVSLSDLCSKEFIDNFIRKGSLTALSINTKIDTDNCACITPEGILVLALNKETYQETGLEGKVSKFSREHKDKYIVQLNLKEEKFTANKAQHQKIKQNLREKLHKFTLILFWNSPEASICPSSVAKYLSNIGYNIQVCSPKFEIRTRQNIVMPVMSADKLECSNAELVEWLGMFAIDSDVPGGYQLYFNSYEAPEERVLVKDVAYVEWKGFFTVYQVQQLYASLIKHLPLCADAPWVSLYIQGFSDAPVNGNLQEQRYFTNGDNAYIMFFEPSGKYMLYTKSCSNKKYNK